MRDVEARLGSGRNGTLDPIAPGRVPLLEREAELDALMGLVRRDGVRLVTVVGQSGVGKTTLAEEAVRRLTAVHPVGARRLDLHGMSADVVASSLLAAADAAGGAQEAGPAPAGRTRLILVDGAETVAGVDAAVAGALDADADLFVLVTSVSPLRIAGEHLLRLEPLAIGPGEGSMSPAVRFLASRLAAHGGPGSLDPDDTEAAEQVAAHLGGLPLALELAAARAATSSMHRMCEELSCRPSLDVFSDLRSTIAWSCEVLSSDQRRLLGELASLPGDAARDSVEVLCGTDEALAPLVDAGLVRIVRPERVDEPLRVSMPLPVREYAGAALISSDRAGELLDRHAEHFAGVARRAATVMWSSDGLAERRRLRVLQHDLIAAIDRLRERDESEAVAEMVADLQQFWIDTGTVAVARGLLNDMPDGLPGRLRARAALCSAELRHWDRREGEPTEKVLAGMEEAACWAEEAGDRRLGLAVAEQVVQTLIMADRGEEALAAATDAQRAAADLGDVWWLAQLTNWRASAANQAGYEELALEQATEARRLARLSGDDERLLWASIVLSGIPGATERLGSAGPVIEDLLELAAGIGDEVAEGVLLVAVSVRRAADGDVVAAAAALRRVLELARQRDHWHLEEMGVMCLASVAMLIGREVEAVRLHGALEPLLPQVRHLLSPAQFAVYEAVVAGGRASLGEERFRVEAGRGAVMGWRRVLVAAEDLIDDIEATAGGEDDVDLSGLTPRELEVLGLMASGMSNKEVAAELGLRPKTVMHHTTSIYRKLGVRGRTEAAAAAWRTGLIEAPEV